MRILASLSGFPDLLNKNTRVSVNTEYVVPGWDTRHRS
jgi:hypothetical protein